MKYYVFPVSISEEGLNALWHALDAATSGNRIRDPHFIVELRNMANTARAMLQKLPEIDDGVDPLLR